MDATVWSFFSLLLIIHFSRAQKFSDDSISTSRVMLFGVSPPSHISLLLLGMTVVLLGGIYLWILRYVCFGVCQPITVGSESEALAGREVINLCLCEAVTHP